MTFESRSRRRLCTVIGTAVLGGFAGCLGDDSDDDGSPSGDSNTSADGQSAADDGEQSQDGGGQDDEGDHGNDDDHEDGDDDHGHGDGDDGYGHGEAPTETESSAEVTMLTSDGHHFDPHVVWVEIGGTVRWHNESGSHSSTLYHPNVDRPRLAPEAGAAWDSGVLSTDDEPFEHTFDTEGVYHYYCTPHEESGMIASVIVGDPDPHEQPALEDPPTDLSESVRSKLESLTETCNESLGHTH